MSKEKNNDLMLKIFALIIAIILWSYVMSEVDPRSTEEYRNINVNLINETALKRQGLVILEPENANIKVSISGRRSDIIKVSKDDIIAQADLSGYSEGEVKVPIYVQVPGGVSLEDYSPKEILFRFDKIINKESSVTIETVGDLPEGYALGTPTVKPQSIVMEGPRTLINKVSKAVASIDVSNSTDDINVSVPIRLVDDNGNDVRDVSTNQNVVDISIPIYKTKTVPIELQTENQLPENYEIMDVNIKPSRVDIIGKEDALKGIDSINTVPIDINSLIKDKDMPVDLEIPEGVRLSDPDKQTVVTLNIEEVMTKDLNYNLSDVKIANLDPELNIDEEKLNVPFTLTVQGAKSIIKPLEMKDIEMELNLEDLKEGTHTVDITVKEKEGVKVSKLSPKSFEITLTRE